MSSALPHTVDAANGSIETRLGVVDATEPREVRLVTLAITY